MNKKARIIIENENNNLCLFYALELSRLYHDRDQIRQIKKNKKSIPQQLVTQQSFDRIKKNKTRQYEIALKLANELGIDPEQTEKAFGLEEIKQVQEFYDRQYPGMYRIVVMDENPEVKPLWKAPLNNAKYEVAIYYENNHYDGLISIAKYYGAKNYCIGINMFYLYAI